MIYNLTKRPENVLCNSTQTTQCLHLWLFFRMWISSENVTILSVDQAEVISGCCGIRQYRTVSTFHSVCFLHQSICSVPPSGGVGRPVRSHAKIYWAHYYLLSSSCSLPPRPLLHSRTTCLTSLWSRYERSLVDLNACPAYTHCSRLP